MVLSWIAFHPGVNRPGCECVREQDWLCTSHFTSLCFRFPYSKTQIIFCLEIYICNALFYLISKEKTSERVPSTEQLPKERSTELNCRVSWCQLALPTEIQRSRHFRFPSIGIFISICYKTIWENERGLKIRSSLSNAIKEINQIIL